MRIQNYLIYPKDAMKAVEFYAQNLFDFIIESTSTVTDPWGNVLDLIEFRLCGVPYVAMDGGDHFKMTDAFSIALIFETQEELDKTWAAFTEKGKELECGWLVDEFGMSWQFIPEVYFELLKSEDKEAVERVNAKVLESIKLDGQELMDAFNNVG